jgi:hypothetical protein
VSPESAVPHGFTGRILKSYENSDRFGDFSLVYIRDLVDAEA